MLLPLACAGGEPHDPSIVPEGLRVMALAGGTGVLELSALTLREGPAGAEIYAALRNVGDVPACSAAVSFELFDHSQQSLASGIGGLLTQRFYRRTDGSRAIAACIGPGDVSMAAVTDLPADLRIDDVGYVVYRCPYFALDVEPIEGLNVSQVHGVARDSGTAYTGTLENALDVAVRNPSVSVFPLSHSGRPLGLSIAQSSRVIEPGDSWKFETNTVSEPGADSAAYPAGAL